MNQIWIEMSSKNDVNVTESELKYNKHFEFSTFLTQGNIYFTWKMQCISTLLCFINIWIMIMKVFKLEQ